MSATSVYVSSGSPSSFLPLQVVLQGQLMGLTQTPFKLFPLCWDSVHVRFYSCLLKAECLCHIVLCLSHMQAPLSFKAKCSRGSSSLCRNTGLGSLMWGWDSPFLVKNLCNCDSSHLSIAYPGVWVVFSHTSSCGSSFISLAEENLFC